MARGGGPMFWDATRPDPNKVYLFSFSLSHSLGQKNIFGRVLRERRVSPPFPEYATKDTASGQDAEPSESISHCYLGLTGNVKQFFKGWATNLEENHWFCQSLEGASVCLYVRDGVPRDLPAGYGGMLAQERSSTAVMNRSRLLHKKEASNPQISSVSKLTVCVNVLAEQDREMPCCLTLGCHGSTISST